MRAAFLIALALASLLTVLVSVWWTIAGVFAKWRRGAMRLPAIPRLVRRVVPIQPRRE